MILEMLTLVAALDDALLACGPYLVSAWNVDGFVDILLAKCDLCRRSFRKRKPSATPSAPSAAFVAELNEAKEFLRLIFTESQTVLYGNF